MVAPRKRKAPVLDDDGADAYTMDTSAHNTSASVTFESAERLSGGVARTPEKMGAASPAKAEKMTPDEAREKLTCLLDEFDAEVEGRCDRMRVFLRALVLSLKKDFAVELIRLPKSVRSMPIEELMSSNMTVPQSVAANHVVGIVSRMGAAASSSPLRDITNASSAAAEPGTAAKRRRIAASKQSQQPQPPSTVEMSSRRSARTVSALVAQTPTAASTRKVTPAVEATPMRAPGHFPLTIVQTPHAGNATVACTPRVGGVQQTPATGRRALRRGETAVTSNGSPVEGHNAPLLSIPVREGGAIEVDTMQGQVFIPREMSKAAIKESILNTQKMLESLLAQMA
eukprot:Opistho-2@68935